MTTSDYARAFEQGLLVAVTLARSGCSADEIASTLPSDPGRTDPAGYSDLLAEIRKELNAGFGDVPQDSAQEMNGAGLCPQEMGNNG